MSDEHKTSWETYTRSWKAATAEEKHDLLDQSMVENGVYRDPLMETHTREALVDYMLDFHKQFPGGHFVTKHYQRHHNVGLVEWEMRNGDNALASVINRILMTLLFVTTFPWRLLRFDSYS